MRLTPLFLLVCLPFFAVGQVKTTPKPARTSPAFVPFLGPKDTLYLTVEDGQKIIQHTVKPKQTLFALSKFYALSLEELYEYNPDFQTDPVLRVGTRVRIPVPNIAIKRYKREGFVASKNAPICYVVQEGDNMFQICKRYFSMPVDSIVKRNKLKSNTIRKGQLLHMGWMGTEGIQLSWRNGDDKPTSHGTLEGKFQQQHAKYKEVSSQGICVWNQDNRERDDLYALHREAAIGSVVAVTNPANKKTTYAKVIGRIPPNYNNSTEVVLSPAAAKRLGASKAEFMVRLKFLK